MKKSQDTENPIDFHGAAIIDGQGHETPITEAMIKQACQQLEQELPPDATDYTSNGSSHEH